MNFATEINDMKCLLRMCAIILSKVKELLSVRTVHAYGGLMLLAAGIAMFDWRVALVAAGGILFYLGIRRIK